MHKCIYCRVDGECDVFDREHVLQQGFGHFRNALVLHGTVCASCNAYFARTLDLALTRESAEGLERYRWGTKSPAEISNFRHSAVTIRADEANEYTGVELRLSPDEQSGELVARIQPSVAIRDAAGDGFTHFTVDAIRDGRWRTSPVDWRRGIRIFGPDPAVVELRGVLERQGVHVRNWRPLERPAGGPRPDVRVTHEFRITDEMRRGYAKIAFNYLASRQGAASALLPAFDPIRRFVRYGEEPSTQPVESSWRLPFKTGPNWPERPVVHWVSMTSHPDHRNLLGVVLLYGFMQHTVMLAENFTGPWPELPQACLYNVRSGIAHDAQPTKPRWRHPDTL